MQKPPAEGHVRITFDLSCDTFDQLRRFAVSNGVTDTAGGIVRWAATQALLYMRSGVPLVPPSLRRPPQGTMPGPMPAPPGIPSPVEVPGPGTVGTIPAMQPPPLPVGVTRILHAASALRHQDSLSALEPES